MKKLLNHTTSKTSVVSCIKRILILISVVIFKEEVYSQDLMQYVQPYSGTASSTTSAALKHSEAGSEKNANTIPSVGLPFGMTQWVAQTRATEAKCIPPYYYKDSLLTGFRGTHWISGSCMQDYGSFTVMPIAGKLKTNNYAIPFSHKNETVTPAYYKLELKEFTSEITASLRCGMMQFTMKQDDSLYLLLIPNSDYEKGFIKIDAGKGIVWGYNPVHRIYQGWGQPAGFKGWFYIKFEKAIVSKGTFAEGKVFQTDSIQQQKGIGAYVGFRLKKGEKLIVRTGTSFSSIEGAMRNLQTEIGNKQFNEVVQAAKLQWEIALAKIIVQTADEKAKRIFYTAMYHAMQHPRLYNDVDGTYPKYAGKNELMNAGNRNYYDDFSMWDIYRAQLPLFEILDVSKTNDFVFSMIEKGKQGGWLPIFPCWNSYTSAMIGDHVTAFIASAYNKGIRNYNVQEAYRLMRKNAFTVASETDYVNGTGRRAMISYLKYNYIPLEDSVPIAFHKKEQVSRTLEYSYDDYALSIVAKDLKKTEDYKTLYQRSFNYQKIFDPSVQMMNGKYADGSFYQQLNPDKRETFITEGKARQYTFYVPHDIPGLVRLMGGRKNFENSLDSLFAKGEYWHGNEPGHQIPYLYNYTASAWKTQKVVRNILQEEYTDGPGGLSGNDDAGQMSAWYVFAAMGFYPVDPVSGEYLLCSSLFDKVSIPGNAGKRFEIISHKTSADAMYISKVSWNGKLYNQNFITHAMIAEGGKLEIWLQHQPSKWGEKISNQPKGLSGK